jgi:multiple sugar transport system ATP-binding protein
MTMGDRIAVFNQGKIEQIGGPMDLYNRPANEFVAGFIGSPRINFIDRPEAGKAPMPHVELWKSLTQSAHPDARRVGIRPEHVGVGSPEQGVRATVELVEQLGDSAMVHLRVDGIAALLIAKIASHEGALTAGQAVGLLTGGSPKALAFDSQGLLLTAS